MYVLFWTWVWLYCLALAVTAHSNEKLSCLKSKTSWLLNKKVQNFAYTSETSFSFQAPFHVILVRLYRNLCGLNSCCLNALGIPKLNKSPGGYIHFKWLIVSTQRYCKKSGLVRSRRSSFPSIWQGNRSLG